MSFVVKISRDYTDATHEAQFIDPPDLKWSRELEGVGEMSFTLPIYDDQIAAILEWNKVELYEIVEGEDILRFSGVILNPEITLQSVFVKCGDAKRYLQKKCIFEDKSWSGETVQNIMTELVDEANARDGGFNGDLTFDTDIGATTVTKDYVKGTTYYEIIYGIAKQLEAEFDMDRNLIKLMETVGTDRSSIGVGDEFVEFVYNINSPNENNISDYRDKRAGNLMVTSLIAKAGSSFNEQTENTSNFGHLEGSVSFPEGDLSDQAAAHLAEHSGSISTTEIEVNVDKIDYSKLNIGDLVRLRVEADNPLLDREESIKILKTEITIINSLPRVEVDLGDLSRVIYNPSNAIASIDKRLKAVELQ